MQLVVQVVSLEYRKRTLLWTRTQINFIKYLFNIIHIPHNVRTVISSPSVEHVSLFLKFTFKGDILPQVTLFVKSLWRPNQKRWT